MSNGLKDIREYYSYVRIVFSKQRVCWIKRANKAACKPYVGLQAACDMGLNGCAQTTTPSIRQ